MGWIEGQWIPGALCEDAPCCGCCGVRTYEDEDPPYCDACGFDHRGDCPEDDYSDEDDYFADDGEVGYLAGDALT